MRVVVGKKDTQTPIFAERETYLVFSQYGTCRPTLRRERRCPKCEGPRLPRAQQHGSRGYRRHPHRSVVDRSRRPEQIPVRQRRAHNSRGLVKFMFPNQFNVYLHDTPAIRCSPGEPILQPPAACGSRIRPRLRVCAARSAGVDGEKIQEAMTPPKKRTEACVSAIPVYLGYWTHGCRRRRAAVPPRRLRHRRSPEHAAGGSAIPAAEDRGRRGQRRQPSSEWTIQSSIE